MMTTAPLSTTPDTLAETALEAVGGGSLLALDVDRDRPGVATAIVLARSGAVLQVELDASFGTAFVGPAGHDRADDLLAA